MEKIAKSGSLSDSVKSAIRNFSNAINLNEKDKRFLKNTLYNLAEIIDISKTEGNGLFLNPYEDGNGLHLNPYKNK